jgi:hypothetical protein
MHDSKTTAIRRFFSGITEHAFMVRLGIADPQLTDYLSDLLTRFVRSDRLTTIRDAKGRPVVEVVDMLSEAQSRIGRARREVHRQIGDYTLFWAGLYPESLERRQQQLTKDALIDYCEQGKRAYWIASTIESGEQEEAQAISADVLGRLSAEFELCAYGLRQVRAEWERRDDGPAPNTLLIN